MRRARAGGRCHVGANPVAVKRRIEPREPRTDRGAALAAAALAATARAAWREWRAAATAARKHPGSHQRVHRFRIATRRLLALEELLTTTARGHPLRDQLGPAFHAAGQVRNIQVASARLDSVPDPTGTARAVARAARKRLPARVRRFARRLESLDRSGLHDAVRRLRDRTRPVDGSPVAPRGQARALTAALHRYAAARRQLAVAARRIRPNSTDRAVHALRLRLKRVRYMRELLAAPAGAATASVQLLANWQRSLGAIADQRAMLRLVDSRDARSAARARELAALRARLLRAERRRIAGLKAPPRGGI